MALIWRDGYFFDGAGPNQAAKPTQQKTTPRSAGLNNALSI
jgi:hypothetical protein